VELFQRAIWYSQNWFGICFIL